MFSCAACAGYTQTELHCFQPLCQLFPRRGTKRYSLRSYPGNCIQVTVGVARLLGFLMISLQSVGCVLHRRRTAAAPSLPPTRLTLGPHHHNHQHHHQEHQHQTHQQHLDHHHHYHHQHSHYQQQIIGNLTCGYLYTVWSHQSAPYDIVSSCLHGGPQWSWLSTSYQTTMHSTLRPTRWKFDFVCNLILERATPANRGWMFLQF